MDARRWLIDLSAVISVRLLATGIAVANGFHAVSDDDFARVVIAQNFARAPAWDPSGTSWLPFPFWLNGALMSLFGPHFGVARAVALSSSVVSAAAVYVAGYWLGLSRGPRLLAAVCAALLPHAVWLGYATVPEGLTAAACLVAVASTRARGHGARAVGAFAMLSASLSRYETWPVALCVGYWLLRDAWSARSNLGLVLSALPLLGPLAWLVHGQTAHADPLFFVSRVAAYRHAVGQTPETWQAFISYPSALLSAEPELMAATAAGLLLARRAVPFGSLQRPLWAACAVVLFLVLGDLRDGAPTHHPERPLLFVWLVACVVLGAAFKSTRPKTWAVPLTVAVVALLFRPWLVEREPFVDRREHLRIGAAARERVGSGELVVDVGDYG